METTVHSSVPAASNAAHSYLERVKRYEEITTLGLLARSILEQIHSGSTYSNLLYTVSTLGTLNSPDDAENQTLRLAAIRHLTEQIGRMIMSDIEAEQMDDLVYDELLLFARHAQQHIH